MDRRFKDMINVDTKKLISWNNSDPRLQECSNFKIVITRPIVNQGCYSIEISYVGMGNVDTYQGKYHIHTTFEDHSNINPDDEWDDAWWWIEIPEISKI